MLCFEGAVPHFPPSALGAEVEPVQFGDEADDKAKEEGEERGVLENE